MSFVNVILATLKMPYFRNFQAVSGEVHNTANHEDAVAHVFEEHGYSLYQEGGV